MPKSNSRRPSIWGYIGKNAAIRGNSSTFVDGQGVILAGQYRDPIRSRASGVILQTMESDTIEPVARPVAMHRRGRLYGLLIGVLVLVVSGWFGRLWLGERLADQLRTELAARGYYVSWDSAAFFPGRGITFTALQLHRKADHTGSLLTWDRVTIRKAPADWKSLHLHAAGSELVIGERDESLHMTDLAVDLDVDREGVSVRQWSGLAHGLRVEVAGSVLFSRLNALLKVDPTSREGPPAPASKGLEDVDLAFLRSVAEWMKLSQLGDKEIRLVVSIKEREAASGYLLRADLDSAELEWRGQRFPALGITMEWPLTGQPEPILVSRLMTSPAEKGQKLALSVDLVRQEVRVNAESAVLHPVSLLAAVVPTLADALKRFHVDQASHWQIAGVVPWGGNRPIKLAGKVSTAGPLRFTSAAGKSMEVTQLQVAFDLDGKTLALKDLAGSLWGGRVQIAETQSNLQSGDWVLKGVQFQGIDLAQASISLGWSNGPTGAIDGSFQGAGGRTLASVQAQGSVRAAEAGFPSPDGLGQPMGGNRQIAFKSLQSGFALHDQSLVLTDLAGSLWGGRMRIARAVVNLRESTWVVNGAQIQDIQILLMKRSLGLKDQQEKGVLHAAWQGGGALELKSLSGQGSMRVTNESFDKLPLLGPLSLVFAGLAPGLAGNTRSRMETNYALRSGGVLTLSDLKVDSAMTQVQAEGEVNLLTEQAKVTAQARLRGIAALPTALLGRMLTFDGEGTLSNMQWRLRPGILR